MAECTIKLVIDQISVAQCKVLLQRAADLATKVPESTLSFSDLSQELFTIDVVGGLAVSANEVIVRLNPSDALLDFVSTFSTRNSDDFSVQCGGAGDIDIQLHSQSPAVGCGDCSIGETGGDDESSPVFPATPVAP